MEKRFMRKVPEMHPELQDRDLGMRDYQKMDRTTETLVSDFVNAQRDVRKMEAWAHTRAVEDVARSTRRMEERSRARAEASFLSIKQDLLERISDPEHDAMDFDFLSGIFEKAIRHNSGIVQVCLERGVLPYMPDGESEGDLYYHDDGTPDYAFQLYQRMSSGELDDDILKEIFTAYQESVEGLQSDFEKKLPEYQREFLTDVQRGFDAGWFLLSPQEVERRLSTITSRLADESVTILEDIHGHYRSDDREVEVATTLYEETLKYSSINIGQERFKKVLWHEWLHAVSGRTVLGELAGASDGGQEDEDYNEDGLDYEEEYSNFSVQRIGLSFRGRRATGWWERLRWLNEAVTEHTAQQLRQQKEMPDIKNVPTSYRGEQELLRALIENSDGLVTMDLVARAYWENIGEGDDVMEGFRDFSRAMREAYGDGILVRIDKYIRANKKGAAQIAKMSREEIKAL